VTSIARDGTRLSSAGKGSLRERGATCGRRDSTALQTSPAGGGDLGILACLTLVALGGGEEFVSALCLQTVCHQGMPLDSGEPVGQAMGKPAQRRRGCVLAHEAARSHVA